MSNIRVKAKGTIKKLDKEIVEFQKFKNNIDTAKEKLDEFTTNENKNTPEEYANSKLQNDMNYALRKGITKANGIGKNSLKDTQENFTKMKEKINNIKSNIIKKNTKRNIKTSRNITTLTKKGIKTTEQVAKNSEKIAKESIKNSQRTKKVTQEMMRLTAKGMKLAVKATIQTIKAIMLGAKAIISAIFAGGWVVVLIVIVICIIGGAVVSLFHGDGNGNMVVWNEDITKVAKMQVGVKGGEPYWSWYGFDERVEWCACFVSWCANACGKIENGMVPKFAVCQDGVNWFKEKNEWGEKDEYPLSGDIIFFDWKDSNGNQDGIADHVGIVDHYDIETDTIITIEGNSDDECKIRSYKKGADEILGYGRPNFNNLQEANPRYNGGKPNGNLSEKSIGDQNITKEEAEEIMELYKNHH